MPLRFLLANPQIVDARRMVVQVLVLFVQINLLLMIFNFIPIPPLDGSKVLFAFMDRRTEYQIRPFLEQYGFFILLAMLLVPARELDRRPDHHPDPRCASSASWWASRARQFRAHLRARVAPEERAALVAWTTPGTAGAVRLDARRRPAPRPRRRRRRCAPRASTNADVLLAGLLHDAGKGDTGVWPRVAYSLGERYGAWIWRIASLVPAVAPLARAPPDPRRDVRRRWPRRRAARRGPSS